MPIFDKARQVGRALTKREVEVEAQAWKCPDDGLVVLVIPAGVMIFVTVLCLYLIGDGLRDLFDVRTTSSSW